MHAGQTPRYPICFLTNGGGVTEQQKADELSSWLGVQVRENQAGALHYSLCKYKSGNADEKGRQGSAL